MNNSRAKLGMVSIGLLLAGCGSDYQTPAPVEIYAPGQKPDLVKRQMPVSAVSNMNAPVASWSNPSPSPYAGAPSAGQSGSSPVDFMNNAAPAQASPPPAYGTAAPMPHAQVVKGIQSRPLPMPDLPKTPEPVKPTKATEVSVENGVVEKIPPAEIPEIKVVERHSLPAVEDKVDEVTPPAKSTQSLPAPDQDGDKFPSAANEVSETQKIAESAQKSGPAAVEGDAKDVKFMWPVLGAVVSDFGKTAEGLHNDGINVRVRKGTPVRAAEKGKVMFVGDTVKGFGSLVLIKHPQGWTTTYAHMQKITVAKNGEVKRGQVIGYSGDSGNVTFPQLHFELRKEVKPVNPVEHLVPQ